MRRRSAFLRLTVGLGLAFFLATLAIMVVVYGLVAAHLDERCGPWSPRSHRLADLYRPLLPALARIETRLARGDIVEAVYLLLTRWKGVSAKVAAWPRACYDGSWSTFARRRTGEREVSSSAPE